MTREQAKQLLTSLGIAEPTDEQVTNYLNSVNGEVQKEKDKNKDLAEKAGKADELQKKLDEINSANLTEIEKANKALEEANKKIADFAKKDALREQREKAISNFKITSEQANAIVKDDGSFDYEELGKIIAQKEVDSAKAKEVEIANGNTNPGTGGGKGETKTQEQQIVESVLKGRDTKTADAVIQNYL